MFEQILNLITRGVVALETIAAHYQPAGADINPKTNGTTKKGKSKPETEVEDEEEEVEETPKSKKGAAKETKSKGKGKTMQEPEDEGEEDTPKPKKGKGKSKKAEPDESELRDEIKQMAAIISGGDDDDASDEFADLLEDFEIKSIAKLADDDVEDFHGELKDIVEKYFEVE